MNILIVSEPGVNGVFRYVEALCDFLLTKDVKVHLAYSDVRGSDRLPLLVERIENAGGLTLNLRVDSRPAPQDLRALFLLLKFARRIRPDVIHSHSSKAGALARMLVLCGLNSRQFYHPHAYRGMQPEAGKFVSIFNIAESLLGMTGRTFNISEDEQAFAINRLNLARHRSMLIPSGIDCRRFKPVALEQKKALRIKFNLPPNVPLLGTVCRSSIQKDPLTLYKAFALALQKCPDAYLFHVGEGEMDAELEVLIDQLGVRPRVIRLPYLANTVEAYQAVDGFILTSRYEGFSLAALEAMASNLPVIISEAPGNGDIIRLPLSHLWKSQPGDVAGFADAIQCWYRAYQDPQPVNHVEIAQKLYDSRVAFERVFDSYGTAVPQRDKPSSPFWRVGKPVPDFPTPALFWSRTLLAVGGVGIVAALILTLKASGDVPSAKLIPDWLTRWVNHHGELRNLFAYALLAMPFLVRVPSFSGRLRVAFSLSIFSTAIELAQLFIPTRFFDWADIGLSIAGIFSTWALIETSWRFKRSVRSPALRMLHHLTFRGRSIATASRLFR